MVLAAPYAMAASARTVAGATTARSLGVSSVMLGISVNMNERAVTDAPNECPRRGEAARATGGEYCVLCSVEWLCSQPKSHWAPWVLLFFSEGGILSKLGSFAVTRQNDKLLPQLPLK